MKLTGKRISICAVTCLLINPLPSFSATIRFAGVNLSGAEFGAQHLPGTYGTDYTYPNQTEVNYFQGKGMNLIRLPFRWERLQHTNNAPLDPTELGRLNSFVSTATARGMYVILDPHNFERYYPDSADSQIGLVGSGVPDSVFTNFWGRVASIYRTNQHVIFGLMNEPNTMPTEQLVVSENAAIAAIRGTGATNLILVPGNGWTGAWTWYQNWYGTPNATAMLQIVDPANSFAFDVHQYLDSDGSGTSTNIAYAAIGADRLSAFTQWLRVNHRRGLLGEFAVANSMIGPNTYQIGDEALTNMLGLIQTNADVWLGWAWWAAGPWWGNYMFTLEPLNLGKSNQADQAAMPVLKSFVPLPRPVLMLTQGNQFQFGTQAGFLYQPEFSPNLDSTSANWSSYGSIITGNGQAATVAMQAGPAAGGCYRVRVAHAP